MTPCVMWCRCVVYLELWLAHACLAVTQEGDEGGAGSLLRVSVACAVLVHELDEAVVVRQLGIGLAQTPASFPTAQTNQQRHGITITHS